MKKQRTSQKGITLIALVITIIILLILAGVTISLVLGNNGILKRATNAAIEQRAGTVQEEVTMWKTEKEISKYDGTIAKSKDELIEDQKARELLTEEEAQIAKETGSITIGSQTIVYGTEAKTLVQAFKDGDIKIGDYLDYDDKSLTGEATVTAEKTGWDEEQVYRVDSATNWRVLGLNESGTQLLLISGSPIKKEANANSDDPYLCMRGKAGAINAVENLDKISSIYCNSRYATEARSMKMEDVLRTLNITVDKENKVAYKTVDGNNTQLSESAFMHTFIDYTVKEGDQILSEYVGNKNVGDTITGTGYAVSCTSSEVVDSSSKEYEILFEGTTDAEYGVKRYWLASPGIDVTDTSMRFRYWRCWWLLG